MHIVAEAQRQFPDKPAIFIDMEHALDKPYAEAIGVNTEELLFSQPERGTDALTIVKKMIPYASVIVVDSVPGLVTQAELDANPGDSHMGIQARLMSQHLREVVPSLGLSDAALIFINQLRMKIGVMFGNPETRPGGRALKFWASLTLDIRRAGAPFGPQDAPTGHRIKVKAIKNKVFPPFRVAETNIIYGQGLSKWTDILALATEFDIIEKKGAYYYHNDENVAHGQVQGEAWVAKHPEIEKAVRAKLFSPADDTEEIQAATTELDETPETIEDLPVESEEALELFKSLAE